MFCDRNRNWSVQLRTMRKIKIEDVKYVKRRLKSAKLRVSEKPWLAACFERGEAATEEDKTEGLCRKVRGLLNRLAPQNFETVVLQIRTLEIDTPERAEDVIGLFFEKAVDDPNISVVYAVMCRLLDFVQMSNRQVNFHKLLLTRCLVEFEKTSVGDNAVIIKKLNEVEECADPDKKKELQFELEEYDRQLRKKRIGRIRFIGELYNQCVLNDKMMLKYITDLLENNDERSLEYLCELLMSIGKELAKKLHRNHLLHIFGSIKSIVDNKESKFGRRIKFMLQDVLDLKKTNWVSRKVKYENIEVMHTKYKPLILDEPLFFSEEKCKTVWDACKLDTHSRDSPDISDETGIHITYDTDDSLAASFQRSILAAVTPSAVQDCIEQPSDKEINSSITSSILRYIHGHYNIDEYSIQICFAVPESDFPKVIEGSYLFVLENYPEHTLKTGALFAQMIKKGRIEIIDYCTGLEYVLAQADDLKSDIPKIWDYLAELIVNLICDEVLTIWRLHRVSEVLINQAQAAKLLGPLFKLVISKKGADFMQKLWQSSGLEVTDFMTEFQAIGFMNQFEFMAGDGALIGENKLSYEQILMKLLVLLQQKTDLKDIVNWITANVGKKVIKENRFIKTLATAIFRDAFNNDLELNSHRLLHLSDLLLKYVGYNPMYELQCLYALQALIHKLEHPAGLLFATCDELYKSGIISPETFIAWESSEDPTE